MREQSAPCEGLAGRLEDHASIGCDASTQRSVLEHFAPTFDALNRRVRVEGAGADWPKGEAPAIVPWPERGEQGDEGETSWSRWAALANGRQPPAPLDPN